MALTIKYNSPVILTFALVCTGIFFINSGLGNVLTPLVSISGSFSFLSVIDYLTLVTYVIGHANFQHLVGNMTFILLLGPILEEKYGSVLILTMILATALLSGLFNVLFFNTGLIGASGIVFMFIIVISFTNVQKGHIPLTFILVLILFLGKEVLGSFAKDNISQFAHIFGGIIGSIFGFSFKGQIVKNKTIQK